MCLHIFFPFTVVLANAYTLIHTHWLNDSNQWNSKQCFLHQPNHSISYKFFKSLDGIHSHQWWCALQTLATFSAKQIFCLKMIAVNKFVCIKLRETKRKKSFIFVKWLLPIHRSFIAPIPPLNMNFYWHLNFSRLPFVNTSWNPHFNRWICYVFFFELSTWFHHDVKSFQKKKKLFGYERKTFTS